MEQIKQEIALPIPEKRASLPIIPFYVWIVPGMILSLAAIVIGVRGFARVSAGASDNLFAEYADIFPGQPKSVVEGRGFSCREDKSNYYYGDNRYCHWTPQEGVFSRVEVVIKEGAVYQVDFLLRDRSLKVGDVAAGLEASDYHFYPGAVFFLLPDLFVAARISANVGQFAFYTPVRIITFAASDEPQVHRCPLLADPTLCAGV